jgi:hypothetical protein
VSLIRPRITLPEKSLYTWGTSFWLQGSNLATGLTCRPVGETVADTWSWLMSMGGVAPHRADRPIVGLAQEVEEAILASL